MDLELEIEKPKLTQYQEDILYCDSRFTICEASTKIGKTFCHIWWIYERAHADWNKDGYNHWWVAPSVAQAEIAFNRMKRAVAHTGLYKINETKRTIITPRGSIIHFKTAKDPDSLYGEDVYTAVFDEAPRAKYAAFVALYSTLTATGGPMKMIGNFGGKANWMHLLKVKKEKEGDKQYKYFKVNAWDGVRAGVLSREIVEQAQKDLTDVEFKQLYLAEEVESEEMLLSYETIDDLWTNNHVAPGLKYITADIASLGSDKFVVRVWSGFRVIDRQEYTKLVPDEITKVLKSTAAKFQVPRSRTIYDADGLGIFLKGYLKGAIPFHNGAAPIQKKGAKYKVNYKNLKTQCAYLLAQKINKGEMFFGDEQDVETQSLIIQELECLQSYDTDSEGKVRILPKKEVKEIIGRSPDDLDTLIMRMYPTIRPPRRKPKSRFIEAK